MALLLGLCSSSAATASLICDRLGFELANLSQQIGPTAEARKYARAIVEQKQSLRALGMTMRKGGCSSGSLTMIGGPNETECSHLESKKARMVRNLQILESKRVSVLSEDRSGLERQRLVAALDDNRCNEEPVLVSTPGDGLMTSDDDGTEPLVRDDPSGFETIRVPSTEPNYNGSQFIDLGGAAMNGNFRTMCVRTCDGAYFPVSSHASATNFRRDAQVCSMMCPGSETELYYHSIQSESTEMRSTLTGRPYDELENAYRFRTKKAENKAECGCNFALYYQEMKRRQSYVNDPASIPQKQSSIVWLTPALRSSLQKPAEMASAELKRLERAYVPDNQIRVIGPQFLPDKGIDFTRPLADPSR
ncbi:MAG: hypothetical protein JWM58_1586 [Rhizobium sp.]|nr:hypothetical protein [Rhizobium sp.]